MPTVPITLPASPARRYDVVIEPGLLRSLGPRVVGVLPRTPSRGFIVADAGLPGELIDAARASLVGSGLAAAVELIAPTESVKTLDTAARLLEALASSRHERHDPIIALGGGIVGDVAGYVAAVYRRGVPVIQCPTTLLSMVDSSVGGKTGVNIHVGTSLKKNMVGCFWQPALVLADLDTLRTLPDRHFRCGLAECIKHGLISHATDSGLFEWTRARLDAFLRRDHAAMAEIVERNVRLKAFFVQGDEREERDADHHQGARALLNLGHTFAHALETIPHLSPTNDPEDRPLHHGEAVGLGLIAASAAAAALQMIAASHADAVRHAVAGAGLPTGIRDLPNDDELVGLMAHDKKVRDGHLRLVLPCAPAESRVVESPPHQAVRAGLAAIRR